MIEFFKNHYADTIATLAMLLSLWQLISSALKKRTKLRLTIENVQQERLPQRKETILLCTIVNHSDSPINITRMMLVAKDGNQISCNLRKIMIGEHYCPNYPETDIPRTERVFSVQFPISLIPHGAVSEHVVFSSSLDSEDFQEGDTMELLLITDKKAKKLRDTCKIHDADVMRYM